MLKLVLSWMLKTEHGRKMCYRIIYWILKQRWSEKSLWATRTRQTPSPGLSPQLGFTRSSRGTLSCNKSTTHLNLVNLILSLWNLSGSQYGIYRFRVRWKILFGEHQKILYLQRWTWWRGKSLMITFVSNAKTKGRTWSMHYITVRSCVDYGQMCSFGITVDWSRRHLLLI